MDGDSISWIPDFINLFNHWIYKTQHPYLGVQSTQIIFVNCLGCAFQIALITIKPNNILAYYLGFVVCEKLIIGVNKLLH